MIGTLGPFVAVSTLVIVAQFAPAGAAFASLLGLGAIFFAMTLVWLSLYVLVVSGAGALMRRQGVGRTLEGLAGTVMIGLGLRVASEPA